MTGQRANGQETVLHWGNDDIRCWIISSPAYQTVVLVVT